ncbi:MAG: ribosome maturation factor RimP [Actinomycetota bacterium]
MSTEIDRVTDLVAPIVDDLGLELYDIERRSATIRITIDTPPGSEGGVDLDTIALATRLISREMDHEDPITGKYTLEVTSPGLERHLRTARHFQREVGKDVTIRLRGAVVGDDEPRRVDGKLVGADETSATLLLDSGEERTVRIADVDKARTVFQWGPAPKPGKGTPHPRSGESSKQSNKKAKQS